MCKNKMAVWARLIFAVLLFSQVNALYVSDMYPFGEAFSDTKLDTEYDEDISSAEIKLDTNVKFFSREFSSIFVSFNSIVIFILVMSFYSKG